MRVVGPGVAPGTCVLFGPTTRLPTTHYDDSSGTHHVRRPGRPDRLWDHIRYLGPQWSSGAVVDANAMRKRHTFLA